MSKAKAYAALALICGGMVLILWFSWHLAIGTALIYSGFHLLKKARKPQAPQ